MIEDELGVRSGVNRLPEPVSDRYLPSMSVLNETVIVRWQ